MVLLRHVWRVSLFENQLNHRGCFVIPDNQVDESCVKILKSIRVHSMYSLFSLFPVWLVWCQVQIAERRPRWIASGRDSALPLSVCLEQCRVSPDCSVMLLYPGDPAPGFSPEFREPVYRAAQPSLIYP